MNKPASSFLRFSLGTLFVIIAICCVGAWWWQRPYTVETTEQITKYIDREVVRTQGRRLESLRRQLFDDPVKHGPTRLYDEEGTLVFEEEWQLGMRHGLYRRWDQQSGDLQVELEFDRGELVRVGDQLVEDFMAQANFSGAANERIKSALERVTDSEYLDAPLRDVLSDISERHELPFLIDQRAFANAGIETVAPVTVNSQGLPLFAGLAEILAPLGLTCHFRYDVLWVTTPDSDLFGDDRVAVAGANDALSEQLNSDAEIDYRGAEFDIVLDDLARRHGVRFVKQATASEPVSLSLGRVSLRSAIGILLQTQGLYCEAQGDSLVIRESPN